MSQQLPEIIFLHNPENVEQQPCGCNKDHAYVPVGAIATAKRDFAVKVLAAIDNVSPTKEHGEHRDPWALKLAVELKVRELFTAEGINVEQPTAPPTGE